MLLKITIVMLLLTSLLIPPSVRGDPLGELLPAGRYAGITSEMVTRWQTIEPLGRAYASPDFWREGSQNGPAVRVDYIEAYPIRLDPANPDAVDWGEFDALFIIGQTDRPGILLVTVAYRARGWHCLDAFFIREVDWKEANHV